MKGYIYTLEVLTAMSVILLSIVFIFGAPPAKPEIETAILKHQGFDALEYLDEKGLLRQMNESEIEYQLSQLLPAKAGVSTAGNNLPNTTVIALDYYISCYNGAYTGRKIRVWLWENI